MTTPIGIGLVGVGRHGSRYLHHLANHEVRGAAVAAVCRRRLDAAVPVSGVRVYDDYRAMLVDPRVQAVVVVTHSSLCPDICEAAAQVRKPMLIEKPLAMTGRQARAMVDAADKAGVMLMTAQTMRFDSTVLLARTLIEVVGPLRRVVLTSHLETKPAHLSQAAAPIGAVLEFGIHLLDLVPWLTKREVCEVQCWTNGTACEEPESAAKMTLKIGGGISCELDVARVGSQRIGRLEWVGSEGVLVADWVNRKVTRSHSGVTETWTVEPTPTIPAALQAFVDAIRTGSVPPITGLDGCRAVELAEVCYQSAACGGEWIVAGSGR